MVDAKVTFVEELKEKLSQTLTYDQMSKVMSMSMDVLEGFEMIQIAAGDVGTDDFLETYLSALNVEGKSPNTIKRYRGDIQRMMQAVKVPTRQITIHHIRAYLSAEKERGLSDGTIKSLRNVFSAYFKWLHGEGLIDRNPIANLGVFKCEKKEKETYSEVDLYKLNRFCKRLRDRAIVNFLRSSGCRISEMVGLNRDSLDLNAMEGICHGKGNKQRPIYIDAVTSSLIREYLNSRKDDNEALFVGVGGERLHDGGVRYMLNTLAKAANVNHVYPHKFRRTRATELHRRGMTVEEIAKILGHESIDTTMKYIKMSRNEIKTAYTKYA